MNEFILTDLSTYKVKESVQFYSDLFQWNLKEDNKYYLGGKEDKTQSSSINVRIFKAD